MKLEKILLVFIAAMIVLSLVNLYLINIRTGQLRQSAELAKEAARPAQLQLVEIIDSSCTQCFDIDAVVSSVKGSATNITEERSLEFSGAEAKALIAQYGIEKIPTLIVLGEVNKSNVANLWNEKWFVEMRDGTQTAVYTGLVPPYRDAATGKIIGLVSLKHLTDKTCLQCAGTLQVIDFLQQSGVKFSEEKTVDYTSTEGAELISRFGLQKVPALIISKNVLEYPAVAEVWTRLNVTEKSGFYALHTLAPPYRDLASNRTVGLVSVIYLSDASCADCYEVHVNSGILERLGLVVANETNADVSSPSGKELVDKYGITKIPIIIISPDASAYPAFTQVWTQVGDVAEDGWFVMRSPEILGTYKDLESGTVYRK